MASAAALTDNRVVPRSAPAPVLALLSLALALLPGCKRGGESTQPEPAPGEPEQASAASDAPAGDDAQAQTGPAAVRHPGAALELDIPSSWKQELDGESLMIMSPDEGVLMVFTAVPAADLEDALAALDKQLAETITDSEVNGFSETQLNGMPALFADGAGKMDGAPVELGVALVLTPDGKVVIALGLAQPGVPQETGQQLTQILRSLRPAP